VTENHENSTDGSRVAVPTGRNPLANGIAVGMRIALFILVPLGIIAAIAILFLHR